MLGISPSIFVSFRHGRLGEGKYLFLHQPYNLGRFTTNLKEISRASSYGDKGIKSPPRLKRQGHEE
jgi:hypothetical protein